ncbi:multicopy suppressor of BFA (Brefeldin A) [Recurvomyces mirabilis]|uniref:Multicopy suppressor of BFA (Brefeldin A) n=1 Tax=Recurvomyces mirabilis TaxID=574656 RepID=A0AAE0TS09_9PEZI|nr:multicopy suppressor of BFA (Brefeldin A) [Recurvomyces mirabilis]KAK5151689.1 multicopy suppressor of BFA (Brefeldin A) [Recurvomyces mirabilis]
MADVGTPSAAAMANADPSSAPKDKSTSVAKPERPDEDTYKKELAQAEKELRSSEDRMKQIKAKLDNARPNNKDSPSSKRQQELRAELQQIRTQQQAGKSSRTQVMDKIKRLDEGLKSRINEQKVARSRTPFKSVDEVQQQIDRLQKQVDTGTMKIVDEKKALAEISQLNRQKKGFAGFEDAQKGIDDVKAQIAELRKTMDDPESRAMSDRYTAITTELDQIKAEQDDAFKSLNSMRDERTKAHDEQQKKYTTVKEIKDRYFQSRRAAVEYEREARRIREEKRRVENDAYHRGRRQTAAREKLDEASAPAYQEEIRTAQNLMAYFDPSSAQKAEVAGPGKFAATASRTVEDGGIKGTRLPKKGDDEENYFIGGGGKKNKKSRGQAAGGAASPAPAASKFQLDMGTIDGLGRIDVDPPMSQSDVPAVVEKLKGKLDHWKGDQDRKTKENIAQAQAEIDRLEAEATAAESKAGSSTETARKPAAAKQQVNGSATAGAEHKEDDAVNDVADDLQKTKLEDEAAPEGTA